MRDSQRQRMYNSEKVLCRVSTYVHTVDACYGIIKEVQRNRNLTLMYGYALLAPIVIKDGRRCRNASAWHDGKTIVLPRWARSDRVTLHEFAHIVHMRINKANPALLPRTSLQRIGGAAHGWQFCAIYLDLVRESMGEDAALRLERSYIKHGVEYRRAVDINPFLTMLALAG